MADASWLKTIEQMTPSVRRLASGRIYRVRKNEHTLTLICLHFLEKEIVFGLCDHTQPTLVAYYKHLLSVEFSCRALSSIKQI